MPEIVVPGTIDSERQTPMTQSPSAVVEDFLPADLALAMREDIDRHFADPGHHTPQVHQVWNYWYVPGLYTYLRCSPGRVISPERMQTFMRILNRWSLETLGLSMVTHPYLSMYVSGCRQAWHNDSGNGRFAYVFSLTRDQRATTGGQTLVMRAGDGLLNNLTRPSTEHRFFETIAPRFNRLVLFDDRAPHAVETVLGSMDPVEGRFVLHGHMSEGPTMVEGALPPEPVAEAIDAAVARFAQDHAVALAPFHGPLSLRLTIDPDGMSGECAILLDRVLSPDPSAGGWDDLRESLCERLEAIRYPASSGETVAIVPVMIGIRPLVLR